MVANIFVDYKVIKVIRKAHFEYTERNMWTKKRSKGMIEDTIV